MTAFVIKEILMTIDPKREAHDRDRRIRNRTLQRDSDRDFLYGQSSALSQYRSDIRPHQRSTQRTYAIRSESEREDAMRNRGTNRRPPYPGPPRRKKKYGAPVVLILLLVTVAILAIWVSVTRKPDSASASALSTLGNSNNAAAASQTNELGLPSLYLSKDTSLPLSGKVILLDPGHGGDDPGAVYPATDPEYFEMETNLELALLTKAELEKLGACVILFRNNNEWLSLYSRPAMAHLYAIDYLKETGTATFPTEDEKRLKQEMQAVLNINKDDPDSGGMGIMSGTGAGDDLQLLMKMEFQIKDILYVSIHCNANNDSSLHGTQVYFVTDETVIESESRLSKEDPAYFDRPAFPNRDPFYGRNADRNQFLAQTIYDAVTTCVPELQTNAHQTVKENFAVLREHGLTGVLVETGFYTNDEDRQMLMDPTYQQKIAEGIAQGCSNYFLTGN